MLHVSTHARPLPVLTTEANDDEDNDDDDVQYCNDIDEYLDSET